MLWQDLREYLSRLEELGELRTVLGADWEEEVGGITELLTEQRGSEELPPEGAPLPVRLLGEDLVLFRDDQGRPGLLGIHCSHRGADLSYGGVEDGGLRCIYHGWLYDIHGHCLDQPGEPGGGEHRESICHPAYSCQEKGGIIFTYLGAGEPPLLPNYDWLTVPEDHVAVTELFSECNYLQGNESNMISSTIASYTRQTSLPGEAGMDIFSTLGKVFKLTGCKRDQK